jgi:ABC-type nitrate/sulfonate/bicarbonate transport system substrate-binding protein
MAERDPKTEMGAMSRRRFLGVGGMAMGGLALAACGGEEDTATTTTAAATTTTAGATTTMAGPSIPTTDITGFTVGYNNPNRMLRSPLYVGQSQELGFFEEVGITNFEINDADDPTPPMVGGEYQIALFDSDVLFDALYKDVLDAKMISINLGAQPLILIANAGIETADDLRGKRVGGGRPGQVNEAICKYMLQELGLDWQTDVEFTEMTGGSNDWVQAMLTGQIDATVAFSRHIPLAEAEGGGALYQDFLNAPQGGFAMLTEDLADPSFAAAWNYAYINAHRWVKTRDNFDDLARILSEEFGIDLPDAFFDENVAEIDRLLLTQDMGFDPAEMDAWMEFVVPFGNVPPDINDHWRDYFDLTGLHMAQEAHGLDLNPAADLSSGQELIDNF